ncbi:MAG: GNAT family N-acetyltransferase [Myxococcales bacterium]|nr:GNAT family N-acetyltransferase [Myxococcales bacterium]
MEIIEANLDHPEHAAAIVAMTDVYARDGMGSGAPLAADVRARLVPGLRAHPTTLVFLAYDNGQPIGIATCFRGFSTFAARTLINIHDLAVVPGYRGHGVGKALLAAVATKARALGCVKLTLEVQENNRRARRVYEGAGFAQAVCGDENGGSLFYTKPLD